MYLICLTMNTPRSLLQATFGVLKITDSSLSQDANIIILISIRLTKGM
jgi:hypothetical protein